METDLQDAMAKTAAMDSTKPMPIWAQRAGVEAARLVVSGIPTYLVYTRQDDVEYLGHIYQGDEAEHMAANPNLPGEWFTALGITNE